MKYIHDTTDFQNEYASAVTLGKFDGLHKGHQKLLKWILKLQEEGLYGIVFTIAPEDKPSLFTPEEKKNMLSAYGIDCMIRCPFIPEILGMDPETFVRDVLCRLLHAKYIIVGTDFRFGYNRSGDVGSLEKMQEEYGYTLIVVEKECYLGREISSTYIREALSRADMELVQELMGSPYPIEGTVMHGRQLGREIGIPTINLKPDKYKLLPPYGVYFSDVILKSENKDSMVQNPADLSSLAAEEQNTGTCFHGITNIGCKPTVGGTFPGVETYLYGENEELYGREARVLLRKFHRPEQKFQSVEELGSRMKDDVLSGKEYFGGE